MHATAARILAVLTIMVALSACASAPAANGPGAPTDLGTDVGKARLNEAAGAIKPAAAARPAVGAPASAPSAGSAPAAAQGAPDAAYAGYPDRMIIRNARLGLTVKDVVAAVDVVGQIAQRYDATTAGSTIRDVDGRPVATISLRVPSARYNDVMSALRGIALRVEDETATSQDVTEEYVDLNAQLRNLEAAEAQYIELMKRAQSIEDVLRIQQRLIDVRGQIERHKGRLTYLQRRTDFAQIDVTLSSPAAAFDPFRNVRASWLTSLHTIETIIGVLVATWWLWLIGGGIALYLRRRGAIGAAAGR